LGDGRDATFIPAAYQMTGIVLKATGMEGLVMHLWSNQSFAVLLLASTAATSAIAATPYTGCPAGYHRAESEGGGVGSVNAQTRKAESEGGGVGSVNAQTRKAEALAQMPCVENK
jgi:hypothetical protein